MALSRFAYSEQAAADLKDIYKYGFETFGAAQAEHYNAGLRSSVEIAASFPLIGRLYQTETGDVFRSYNSGRHMIFYRVESDRLLVVRILHSSMDFDRHLSGRSG